MLWLGWLSEFVYLEVAWLFWFWASADVVWSPGHLAVGSDPAALVSLVVLVFVDVHVDVVGLFFGVFFFGPGVDGLFVFFCCISVCCIGYGS